MQIALIDMITEKTYRPGRKRMRIQVAGIQVDLCCSGRTAAQAEAYRAPASFDMPAQLTIDVTGEEVLATDPYIGSADEAEYLGSGECFARALPHFDALMLHACAVDYRGRALCFSAPSGTGKTTHARLWQGFFGAELINDDKPVLRRQSGVWRCFGSPWCGSSGRGENRSAPLAAICFIERGTENRIEQLTPAEAFPLFMSQTVYALPRRELELFLPLADRLLREVPQYIITCRMDAAAAYCARDVIFKLGVPHERDDA